MLHPAPAPTAAAQRAAPKPPVNQLMARPAAPVATAQRSPFKPPVNQVAARPAPPPQAQAAASPAAASAPTGVHFYSLHRAYGMAPDPIAAPTDHPMVLIGPPDNPPQQSQDDAQDGQPKADRNGASRGADD